MKISQLLVSILVLLLAGAGIKYSASQQNVMNVLIAAHGGGQQVDASSSTGLRKLNQELDAERGSVAAERAATVKSTEAARVEMRDSRTRRDEEQSKLNENQSHLAEVQKKAEAVNESVERLRVAMNDALARLKANDALRVDASADFAVVMESIKEVVKNEEERTNRLTEELGVAEEARKKATEKLAGEKVELNRLTAINEKFFQDYLKNDDEYPVLAVDCRWKFVVFNVGADSGLLPGDATPLLVKRGDVVVAPLRILTISNNMVVAEFDADKLQPGVRPELGDRVFRVKPLGN